MTREEYISQMNRLVSTFGKSHYPSERANLIWREVGSLAVGAFENIVSHLIAECRQAPLVPEIRAQAAAARERAWSEQKRTPKVVHLSDRVCSTCHGLGVVLARHREHKSAYAFRCTCNVGRNDPRKFPEWSGQYDQEFEAI